MNGLNNLETYIWNALNPSRKNQYAECLQTSRRKRRKKEHETYVSQTVLRALIAPTPVSHRAAILERLVRREAIILLILCSLFVAPVALLPGAL